MTLVKRVIFSNRQVFTQIPVRQLQVFPTKHRKRKHHRWILHIRISLNTKSQLKRTILTFWTKFTQKGYFQSKTEKSKHHHWIMCTWLNLGTKFQFKQTILIFWTKKGCFWSKMEKQCHHWILYFWISLRTKFHLKLTILIFWTKFA